VGTTTVRFPGGTGAWLVGKLERPDGPERATALFAHCFTCGKDLKSIVRLTRELAARGVASLRFDFSGVGESEGDFAETSFSTNVADILAAADFLRTRGLGPLVGRRTWGGLVGVLDDPPLLDGGAVSAPGVAVFSPEGRWEVENEGVAPDVDVAETPQDAAAGRDPQLEKAVELALRALAAAPPRPARPPYPVKRQTR